MGAISFTIQGGILEMVIIGDLGGGDSCSNSRWLRSKEMKIWLIRRSVRMELNKLIWLLKTRN